MVAADLGRCWEVEGGRRDSKGRQQVRSSFVGRRKEAWAQPRRLAKGSVGFVDNLSVGIARVRLTIPPLVGRGGIVSETCGGAHHFAGRRGLDRARPGRSEACAERAAVRDKVQSHRPGRSDRELALIMCDSTLCFRTWTGVALFAWCPGVGRVVLCLGGFLGSQCLLCFRRRGGALLVSRCWHIFFSKGGRHNG